MLFEEVQGGGGGSGCVLGASDVGIVAFYRSKASWPSVDRVGNRLDSYLQLRRHTRPDEDPQCSLPYTPASRTCLPGAAGVTAGASPSQHHELYHGIRQLLTAPHRTLFSWGVILIPSSVLASWLMAFSVHAWVMERKAARVHVCKQGISCLIHRFVVHHFCCHFFPLLIIQWSFPRAFPSPSSPHDGVPHSVLYTHRSFSFPPSLPPSLPSFPPFLHFFTLSLKPTLRRARLRIRD